MSIPSYEELMFPVMRVLEDKQEVSIKYLVDKLASDLKLSEEELKEQLPSQNQSIFRNRVSWAKTYLKKAGLVDNTKRGYVKITDLGLEILAQKPSKIDNKYLTKFPSFEEFRGVIASSDQVIDVLDCSSSNTPLEVIESSFRLLRAQLVDELLETISSCSPKFFENLVVDLMISMGYGGSNQEAGRAIGKSSDGGIDGVISEDKLGLDTIYLQAKRWKSTVGAPEIRDFVGSLVGKQSNKGVFITTSKFSFEALNYANSVQHKVILIDGNKLAELMIEYGVGVSKLKTFFLKKIDSDYFDEDRE
jgi:restriction system protein